MSRFVTPESCVLELKSGDKLIVKRRLNYGELRRMYERMRRADGSVDLLGSGLALVSAYLLDWQLSDESIPIQGLSVDEIETMLSGLDPDVFTEIRNAIDAHVDQVDAEIKARKLATTVAGSSGH